LAANSLVRPDATSGLLSYLTPIDDQWWLRQYSHATYALMREFRIPHVAGTPRSLVRWGTDGLAFLTTSNQVYLLRPPLGYADLAVSHQSWPTQVIAGQSFQLRFSATNHGPSFAAAALVTNLPPAFTTVLDASASQGTFIITNNRVVFFLGDVPTSLTVTLSVMMTATNSVDASLTNTITADNAFTDLTPANNASAAVVSALADRDLDGVPDDWEIAHGFNPTNAVDAALDSDCDGWSNLQEFLGGRNPRWFEDIRLTSPMANSQGQFEMTFLAAVGKHYAVEASSDLVDWETVTNLLVRMEQQKFQLPVSYAVRGWFFRLRTDTNSPRPVLDLLNVPNPPTGSPVIRVLAPPGRDYSLQTSSNLVNWATLSNYFGMECVTVIADPATNQGGTRFYRMLLP
jgi:hypothetical protein